VSADDPFTTGLRLSIKDDNAPIKAQNQLNRTLYNRSRIRHHGPLKTHMPDFNKMVGDNDDVNNAYDSGFFRDLHTNPLGEGIYESFELIKPVMTDDINRMIESMKKSIIPAQVSQSGILREDSDKYVELDDLDQIDVLIEGDNS
jgi:hypothetical protein